MEKLRRYDKFVTIAKYTIYRLRFADNLVLLTSFEFGLQHALNGSAAACDIAGMKISTSKTEVLYFLINLVQYSLQAGGESLK